jgi:hypothetical protein
MQISNSSEQADLFQSIWSVLLNQVWVLIIELDRFHIPHIIHDLELLHEVILHSFFNHVTACKVPPHSSLDNVNITSDHQENITMDLHSKERLESRSRHIKSMDFSANNQASQAFLKFFRTDMQP